MDSLAITCEEIARTSSRNRKIAVLSDYFRTLTDDDLALAVQFLSVGPVAAETGTHSLFPTEARPKLSIGYSVLREALQQATNWDRETLRVCHTEVGDAGETTGLLMRNLSANAPLTLSQSEAIYQQLFQAGTTARKVQILVDTYRRYRPPSIKYFVKVITRGLRIGLISKMVEEAIAQSCDIPAQTVRDANNRLGDLAAVAVAARTGKLGHIEARLFHPMEFMLAKPLERLEDLGAIEDWLIEDKYDGIRSQIHFDAGRVRIYSRGMEEVTAGFPELVERFKALPGSGLVDGEILAWRDGRALSFNVLQQRLARKTVRASLLQQIPVSFIAYDLLIRDGEEWFDVPLENRRAALSGLLPESTSILISPQTAVSSHEAVDDAFRAARDRGNEGLLLKRKGSLYEPGKRSGAWYKLKRPYGTLDVVITAAERGSGRRAIVLSDYTFAVRSGDDFLNVGKAYSGLTDTEVRELTRVLRSLSVDKFGPVLVVRPEVVLEVAFDGVQKSARHKSGYALRFPRIVRWRRDKKAAECDDLARIKELYEASVQ